jgi:hypothetical protein
MLSVTDNCRGRGGDSPNRRPCWTRKAIQFGADPTGAKQLRIQNPHRRLAQVQQSTISKAVGQFDCGSVPYWKSCHWLRHIAACQNPVIDPVNAARFMTAASTLKRLARSAALNTRCAARPSRIGTPLGCLDIGSSPVQPGNPNDSLPNAP